MATQKQHKRHPAKLIKLPSPAKQAIIKKQKIQNNGNLHELNLGRHFSFIAISKRDQMGLHFHSQKTQESIF